MITVGFFWNVAAIATTGYGAVDPLPRPHDVDALLRRAA